MFSRSKRPRVSGVKGEAMTITSHLSSISSKRAYWKPRVLSSVVSRRVRLK
jgi:hypothetical protein